MCTVTIIPLPSDAPGRGGRVSYRLVANRDESRRRAAALPPRRTALSAGVDAVWPIDPEAGGTWIAAAASGLTITATNLNPSPRPRPPAAHRVRSRGLLIPQLIDAADAPSAMERLHGMDLTVYRPFRLVAVDGGAIVEARWALDVLTISEQEPSPACYVSSGLGDHVVADRLPLFGAMLDEYGATRAMQDAYHRHVWPDRPEASVMMSRDEARTVSTTVVEVTLHAAGASVMMAYHDDAGSCRVYAGAGSAVEPAGLTR